MLYSAFLLGLFGSVHCVGMCGPLVLAFGQTTKSMGFKLTQQFGRILGYGILGALIGLIGSTVAIFEVGQWVSLSMGIVILAFTLFSFFKKSAANIFTGKLVTKLQSFALKNTQSLGARFFLLGIINSLLPCGLLFVALGVAATQGTLQGAVLYMLVFGFGTLPSLLGVLFFGHQLGAKFKSLQSKMIPVLSLVVGLMMVVRGLGLGIPYLSPKINHETKTAECCKHKTEQCEVR